MEGGKRGKSSLDSLEAGDHQFAFSYTTAAPRRDGRTDLCLENLEMNNPGRARPPLTATLLCGINPANSS